MCVLRDIAYHLTYRRRPAVFTKLYCCSIKAIHFNLAMYYSQCLKWMWNILKYVLLPFGKREFKILYVFFFFRWYQLTWLYRLNYLLCCTTAILHRLQIHFLSCQCFFKEMESSSFLPLFTVITTVWSQDVLFLNLGGRKSCCEAGSVTVVHASILHALRRRCCKNRI